jgi:alcohol dehydrogenase
VAWDAVHAFECPTLVRFGRGAADEVGEQARALGLARVVLVSDPGVAGAGIVDRVAETLRAAGVHVAVYAETEPNPTTVNVADVVALYRSERCDGLVGVGGGSSMDCAKAAGMLVTNGGEIADYRGKDVVREDGPPVICVPTTCGTGSEVTFVVVITDPTSHLKVVCVSRRMAARVALVDPSLVESAPSGVIAATGADALCHAVESYVNTGADPLLDALNIAAIRMIGASLRPAVAERDAAAIEQLSLASTMAGIAFNMNANAIVHAASTPVTAHHGVPHGVANGIFMPDGLAFIAPACQPQLRAIAAALGEDVAGLDDAAAADRALVAIRELMRDVGIPATLREYGLDPAAIDIPRLVKDAMLSRNIATNPRPVGEADLAELYTTVIG